MAPIAIERKNHSGSEPEWLETAIERGENIPLTAEEINTPCHCTAPCPVCVCREGGCK